MHFLIRKTTNIQNLFTGLRNKSKCQLMKECAKQAWLKTYWIQCLCAYTLYNRVKLRYFTCPRVKLRYFTCPIIFLKQCYTTQRSWVQWNVIFLNEKLSRIVSGCKHLTLYSLPDTYIYIYATGWMVRGLNPGGGKIFCTHPDRLWGPPSLIYNGYQG
jgi:hypothetical protein